MVNSLEQLLINQESTPIRELDCLGIYINATTVSSIEHKVIVFVENLTVMANLNKLVFSSNSAYLKDALWVYRGDLNTSQTTGRAYAFFRQFKHSHELISFADFDPEGLRISLTCGAKKLLAPILGAFKLLEVNGPEQEYYDQDSAKVYIESRSDLSDEFGGLIQDMKTNKRTIQQEHILAHQIPVMLYQIS